MNILFPSDDFDAHSVDSAFSNEFHAARAAGFHVGLLRMTNYVVNTDPGAVGPWIYRGWMMTKDKYAEMACLLHDSIPLAVSPTEYASNHHISGWIDAIKHLTPETKLFESRLHLALNTESISFSPFFVKDYVKSLTTKRGSIARNFDEILEVLNDIEKYRGELEGGITIRRVHNFVTSTERRYFVFKNKLVSFIRSGDADIILAVMNALGSTRTFYSIDIINDAAGVPWVVEVGDGQVSDLKGKGADAFYNALFKLCAEKV